MANIIPLKDSAGAQFYPQTHEKAVVDSNGVTLASKLAGTLSNEYVPVDTLPAASASTVGKKYVVPISGSTAKEIWVTSESGSTYTWVSLGTMEDLDLSGYTTDEQFNQLDQKVNDLIVPEGYRRLEWLGSDSTAYIDTGVGGKTGLSIKAEMMYTAFVAYGSFFGNYVNAANGEYRMWLGGTNGSGTVNVCDTAGVSGTITQSQWFKLNAQADGKVYINGVLQGTATPLTTAATANICIFERSVTSHPSTPRNIGMRLRRFTIVDNGATVRDFFPMLRLSDGVAGLYDMINGVFYTKTGVGAFTYGDVENTLEDVENMLKYDALKIATVRDGYAISWTNGAYTTGTSVSTYVVKNDGFTQVEGVLGGGVNVFAWVAFYSTDGVDASGFMSSSSLRMGYASYSQISVPVPSGCKTIAIVNRQYATPSASLSVANIAERIPIHVGEYPYGGKIQLERNYFNLLQLAYTSTQSSLGDRQGMDIFNGIAFIGRDGGDIEAVQLSDMSVLDTFKAACASEDAHMNCINFGKTVASGSTFPLAYIPAGGVGSAKSMQCSVEKIVEESGSFSAEQVQVITLDTSGFADAGLLPPWDVPTWLIDKERGYLWTFGAKYRTRPGDASILENVYVAHQYNIPDTSNASVTLTASDVLRECRFPFNVFLTQGGTMVDGKIYYLFGYGTEIAPSIMQVYDTDDCGISARVLLNDLGQGEAEDVSIYDGKMYIDGSQNKIIRLTFLP